MNVLRNTFECASGVLGVVGSHIGTTLIEVHGAERNSVLCPCWTMGQYKMRHKATFEID